MHARRLSAIILMLVMSLPIASPLVAAQTPSDSVAVTGTFAVQNDGAFPYQHLLNFANASDMQFSNYNLTWAPLYAANPDISGLTVTPFPAPVIIRQNGTSIEAVQRVRFSENELLDGVSQSWWRSPVGNIPTGATVTMILYRADSNTVNLSSISSGIVFDNATLEQKVWNETLDTSTAYSYQYRVYCIPVAGYGPLTHSNLSTSLVAGQTDSAVVGPFGNPGAQVQTDYETGPFRLMQGWFKYTLQPTIPACARILNANLSLMQTTGFPGPDTDHFDLNVSRARSGWTQAGMTYANRPALTNPIDTKQTVYVPTDNPCPAPSGAYQCDGRVNFNITPAVQFDSSQQTTNGVAVTIQRDATTGFQYFTNGIGATGAKPYLNVDWQAAGVGYNFSLLSVYAPLFPNKNYWAYWHVTYGSTHPFHLYYTPGDMNNDQLYQSWVRVNGGATRSIPVDMDESVVMTRGMSSGIAGLGLDCSVWGQACPVSGSTDRTLWYLDAWTGNVAVTNTGGHYVYANIVMPWVSNRVNATVAGQVAVGLDFSDHAGVMLPCIGGGCPIYNVYWNGTLSKTVVSVNISALAVTYPEYLGKHIIDMSLKINFNYWALSGWAYLTAKNGTKQVNLCMYLSANDCVTMGYGLYGYFSIDNFFFENTDKAIVLVPVQLPNSELGILQAWQQWQVEVSTAQQICNIEMFIGSIPIAGELTNMILNNQCIAQGIMDRNNWILHTILEPLAQFFSPVINFLYGVGAFIWSIITFFVRAIQWFLYWGVKFINIFIVMCVWIIVFMAPFYVGKAFNSFFKKGLDAEEMKSVFKEGWTNTWSVLALILSFVTVAVSSVAAVIGVLKP